ncbi:MAG: hypothetical protein R3328_01540 [Planococcaceae bacterium]|nr:hypothetical protein [Planococcaceae bacterium]
MDRFDKDISQSIKGYLNKNVNFKWEEGQRIQNKIENKKLRISKFNPVYWSVLSFAVILFILLGSSYLNKESLTNEDNLITAAEQLKIHNEYLDSLNEVTINVKNKERINNQNTMYLIEIKNNSPYPILEGNLLLSHDIKTSNGIKENPYKIFTPTINELKSGGSISIEVMAPNSVFDAEMIEVDNETIELQGYIKERNPALMFSIKKSSSGYEPI